ncbi:MAG: SDR family oxidoreductase [Parvibaculales bacterium]
MTHKHLFCFGYSYSAQALVAHMQKQGADGQDNCQVSWQVSATYRTPEKKAMLEADGVQAVYMPDGADLDAPALAGVTHILLSAPPDTQGMDPVLAPAHQALVQNAAHFEWVGYLSTTGVYGDHDGAWIDEDTPYGLVGARGLRRRQAEAAWAQTALPMHYFRLAGIYGPGRNMLESLKAGKARRIHKPGQVFSRIHVADIAQILWASMNQPNAGRAYSVCDDEPAPPQDVVVYAAELLGLEPPPLIDFEQADLSPMAKSFYGENKRIRNDRIKRELGVQLYYPTYRDGLNALYKEISTAS